MVWILTSVPAHVKSSAEVGRVLSLHWASACGHAADHVIPETSSGYVLYLMELI